jgi:Xaa-Pro aminopeptidase
MILFARSGYSRYQYSINVRKVQRDMPSWKIELIRKELERLDLNALIIPSTDPHQSEYVPSPWQRRSFISDFNGSAGDLVVTTSEAALWTDSRYYLQAEKQLENTGIDLCRQGTPSTPSIQKWLRRTLTPGDKVGIDPHLFSYKMYQRYEKTLSEDRISLIPLEENPVDAVWTDRPAFSSAPASVWPDDFAGRSVDSKLDDLRKKIKALNATLHVITTLDAIAWLFNIRGQDVPFNPVTIAYAVVGMGAAYLFMDSVKVTNDVRRHLADTTELHDYQSFGTFLDTIDQHQHRVLLDPDTVSQWIVDHLGQKKKIIFKQSPIALMKSQKNPMELKGFESSHIRDGVAMVKFLSWLDDAVSTETVTEISAAKKLTAFRENGKHYVGPSFGTISAFGENGAIVHYEADEESNATLSSNSIYLIDSGAQYLDGTTDITRTVALGVPTAEQRRCFTLVLKGHLNLIQTTFPTGTTGNQLDTIARKPLWDVGLNYGHGTGHGVGAYLNVHEGPYAISYYRGVGVPLKEGMVLSIEPGCYKPGGFGIRIENLVSVVKNPKLSTNDAPFLMFEPLTLCPIDRRLIDETLLAEDEMAYLNRYHDTVYRHLAPLLSGRCLEWLKAATAPLKS